MTARPTRPVRFPFRSASAGGPKSPRRALERVPLIGLPGLALDRAPATPSVPQENVEPKATGKKEDQETVERRRRDRELNKRPRTAEGRTGKERGDEGKEMMTRAHSRRENGRARLSHTTFRHGRIYSGHPRLVVAGEGQAVDARDKPGHDECGRDQRPTQFPGFGISAGGTGIDGSIVVLGAGSGGGSVAG